MILLVSVGESFEKEKKIIKFIEISSDESWIKIKYPLKAFVTSSLKLDTTS